MNDRISCSLRLEPENTKFLDKEVVKTGKSRSDIANRALSDYQNFWPKVAEIIDAQNVLLLAFQVEVREIHKNHEKEHEQILTMLDDIKKYIMCHNETTKD